MMTPTESQARSIAAHVTRIVRVAYRTRPAASLSLKLTEYVTAGGDRHELYIVERRSPGRGDQTLTVPYESEREAREAFDAAKTEGIWSEHAPEVSAR